MRYLATLNAQKQLFLAASFWLQIRMRFFHSLISAGISAKAARDIDQKTTRLRSIESVDHWLSKEIANQMSTDQFAKVNSYARATVWYRPEHVSAANVKAESVSSSTMKWALPALENAYYLDMYAKAIKLRTAANVAIWKGGLFEALSNAGIPVSEAEAITRRSTNYKSAASLERHLFLDLSKRVNTKFLREILLHANGVWEAKNGREYSAK